MTTADWLALAFVSFATLAGLRKGLIASALSAVGIVLGAALGSRLAPLLLASGSRSPYTPLVALAGAVAGAILLETLGTMAGLSLRRLLVLPPLRALDTVGGAVLGAVAGLAVVWVVGAVALLLPGQREFRVGVQRSRILSGLNQLVPPRDLLSALARVDPFPAVTGPLATVAPPDPRLLADPAVRRAAPSVVKILGTACGLSVEGSGWVARPEEVVTAAHVVAGQDDTTVVDPAGNTFDSQTLEFDAKNDVAVLRVPGLAARPLPLVDPVAGRPVVLLGYPEDGPLTPTPGRLGRTSFVLSRDAYGHGPVGRIITSLRANVRHGDSGGPVVDRAGAVEATVFASRPGGTGGFATPAQIIRRDLAAARRPVSTGACAS